MPMSSFGGMISHQNMPPNANTQYGLNSPGCLNIVEPVLTSSDAVWQTIDGSMRSNAWAYVEADLTSSLPSEIRLHLQGKIHIRQ